MPRFGIEQIKKGSYFSVMDYWLLIPILTISVIGLSVVNKVLSSGFDTYPMIFYKQAGAMLVGLLIALMICVIEVPTLKLVGWGIYGLSVLLLIWTLIDGYSKEALWGADSWIELPIIGTFQASELTKIGLAMTAAFVFEGMQTKTLKKWQGSLILLGLFAIPVAMIMKQPDFGTTMVIVFMFLAMLFIWGLKWRYVLLGFSGVVIAAIMAWLFYFSEMQKARIITFLYPGQDPTNSYNLLQAQFAIASGGLIGSAGETPVHVPVKEADFIYTAVSEHMGFIGTTALLVLIFFFLARCLYVASKVHPVRPALAYMMVGLTASMAFHFVENLGMCVGLLPITGIPLPFVSLGGTAMIVNFFALGVMLCISMERNLNK